MDVAFECIPCTVQSCLRLLDEGEVAEERREDLLRQALLFLAGADWQQSPPALARDLHAQLRRAGWSEDPYREIKHRSNLAMLERAGGLRDELANATDPFGLAVRLAVAGNVIDFGARHLLDPAETLRRVLTEDLAIDDTEQLREDLAHAQSVLYLGDNAGEIVLDGLLLETMAHPAVTFVVRGGPVLNDATLDDAHLAGIQAHAQLTTSGDDTPGVIPHRVSSEVREALDHMDVVIAKGQGNLEGLWDLPRDVYFLLTVKCERIARHIGVQVGDFVVWKRRATTG
jgi:uncharacterized protein with ATP-grasp and redox domains